jgi:hypothetical protein
MKLNSAIDSIDTMSSPISRKDFVPGMEAIPLVVLHHSATILPEVI